MSFAKIACVSILVSLVHCRILDLTEIQANSPCTCEAVAQGSQRHELPEWIGH